MYGGNGIRGFTSGFTHEGRHVLIGRQGALCGNVNYADGQFWASEHAVVADIRGEHNPTWLGELLRAMNLNQYSQSAAQPGLAVEVIANLEIPVPPLSTQRAIADYLDAETARIDELIAAKEKLLSILAEKRKALVTEAVTRGLDPSVPMRDSGIPWLGEISAHWDVTRVGLVLKQARSERGLLVLGLDSPLGECTSEAKCLWGECEGNLLPEAEGAWNRPLKKFRPKTGVTTLVLGLVAQVQNGSTPSRSRDEFWDADGIPWVFSGQVNDYVVVEADERISEEGMRSSNLSIVSAGSILVGMIGQGRTRGMSARLSIDACINQNVAAVTPKDDRLNGDFLHFVFEHAYDPLRNHGRGGNQPALNCELIGEFPVQLPPPAEQAAIARAVSTSKERLQSIEAAIMASLPFIQERREAIIAAAVTG